MKVAAICDFPYWESRIGSAVRHGSLCNRLAGSVDLTSICTAPLPETHAAFRQRVPYRLMDRSALVPSGKNVEREELSEIVGRAVVDLQADAVLTPYFNRAWMIAHVPRDVIRIIDTHDCQSQRTQSFARHGLTTTFSMTPAEESRMLSAYDMAFAMSDEDASLFRDLVDIPVITAPFRLPVNDIYRRMPGQGWNVLFLAAQSPVNDLTLDYLVREVLPLVRVPFTLNVVGTVKAPETLSGSVPIVFHGKVEDLSMVYGATDLSLNPTFAGGGVKTKTLEAMSAGVPVLTTDEGARGLRHLLPDISIANDKETFAHRTTMLLSDGTLRQAVSEDMLGRLRAERHDSWTEPFVRILRAARARAGVEPAMGAA